MTNLKATVSIDELKIGYQKGSELFPPISIDAFESELVALVGRNGVGKSTLIKTLIGQLVPISGTVRIINQELSSINRKAKSKLLSYVPSEPVRVANLFIRDFVAVSRFPYLGWTRSLSQTDWQIVDHALLQVGIEHLSDKDISSVSDGERQRAMIAFALAQDTKIIILDEPTAFLDLPNKFEMVKLLSQLAHENNKTIIYSTHDLQGAIHEADIIWMMLSEGLHSGAPEELAIEQQFQMLLSKTEVQFDSELGTFKNFRKPFTPIGLEGHGLGYKWTKRMLERLGFEVVDKERSNQTVFYSFIDGTSEWRVKDRNGLIYETKSITDLSRKIRGFIK